MCDGWDGVQAISGGCGTVCSQWMLLIWSRHRPTAAHGYGTSPRGTQSGCTRGTTRQLCVVLSTTPPLRGATVTEQLVYMPSLLEQVCPVVKVVDGDWQHSCCYRCCRCIKLSKFFMVQSSSIFMRCWTLNAQSVLIFCTEIAQQHCWPVL